MRAEATGGPAPLVVATAMHRYGSGQASLFTDELIATMQSGAGMVLLTDRPDGNDADVRLALRDVATVVTVDAIDVGLAVAADWLRVDDAAHLRSLLDALADGMCVVAAAPASTRSKSASPSTSHERAVPRAHQTKLHQTTTTAMWSGSTNPGAGGGRGTDATARAAGAGLTPGKGRRPNAS